VETQVTQLKAAIVDLFTAFAAALTNPKPTYSLDGQSVSHGEYLKMLIDAVKGALEILQMIEPFEHRSMIL
jgi:hypothetical protein